MSAMEPRFYFVKRKWLSFALAGAVAVTGTVVPASAQAAALKPAERDGGGEILLYAETTMRSQRDNVPPSDNSTRIFALSETGLPYGEVLSDRAWPIVFQPFNFSNGRAISGIITDKKLFVLAVPRQPSGSAFGLYSIPLQERASAQRMVTLRKYQEIRGLFAGQGGSRLGVVVADVFDAKGALLTFDTDSSRLLARRDLSPFLGNCVLDRAGLMRDGSTLILNLHTSNEVLTPCNRQGVWLLGPRGSPIQVANQLGDPRQPGYSAEHTPDPPSLIGETPDGELVFTAEADRFIRRGLPMRMRNYAVISPPLRPKETRSRRAFLLVPTDGTFWGTRLSPSGKYLAYLAHVSSPDISSTCVEILSLATGKRRTVPPCLHTVTGRELSVLGWVPRAQFPLPLHAVPARPSPPTGRRK